MKNKKILLALVIPVLLIIGKIILQADFIYFFKFWSILFIIGLISFPLTSIIFKKFKDKGWIFSKIIGVAISSWLLWFLSNLKILKFTAVNSYIIIALLLIINLILVIKKFKKQKELKGNYKILDEKVLYYILLVESLFIVALIFWTYVKGYSSLVTSTTEQFMDFGYINSIMNSEYMPPRDLWFSGHTINYYYFGQYVSAFLCKISNISAREGYYLINALLGALSFIMPFSIGLNLLKVCFKNKFKKFNKVLPLILALFIGIGMSIGGTLHYPIYRWFSKDKASYYFVDETRYIGEKPQTQDKAVTELPSYSTILGDLHAHYLDIIFVYTTLALLLQYFLTYKKYNIKSQLLNLNIILLGFMLGIQRMTNYWDFPIYLVIISAIIITKNLICGKFNLKELLKTGLALVEILLIEEATSLLFNLDLQIASTNVFFTTYSSPVYKLAVLWGLQAFCFIAFFTLLLVRFKFKNQNSFKKYLVRHTRDLYIIILAICALGLVFLPELIYLKDIYGDDYQRFNTMFKLTYQAYVLLSITTNYIVFKLLTDKSKAIKCLGTILLIMNTSTFGYGIDALKEYYFHNQYRSIASSEEFLHTEMPEDYDAIQWIKQNIEPSKIILESTSVSSSYSNTSRVSVFTGNPTVLGWMTHEWLWRMNKDYSIPKDVTDRNGDILTIYTTADKAEAKKLLTKYDVSYIYIGSVEYKTYENINLNNLLDLGEIVYESKTNPAEPTYILKVNNQ